MSFPPGPQQEWLLLLWAQRWSIDYCTGWLKIKKPTEEYAISPQPVVILKILEAA